MKYVFIVNPASGQGKHEGGLIPKIEQFIKSHNDKDISIVYTRCEGDATVQVDRIAKENKEETIFFACGGDGTVQEVAKGAIGNSNAVLAVVPVGSGNDFVRTLGHDVNAAEKYSELDNHLKGIVKEMDLLKITYIENGETVVTYADNGINIGFDGNAAILAHELKTRPLVSGMMSYVLAVASCLIKKKGQNLRITADGEPFHEGPLLLVTAANGGYCGSGVQSCPNADLYNGKIELMAINDMSRRQFVALFNKYKDGKIFEIKNVDKLIKYKQAEIVTIEPMAGRTMKFVADGEILETGAIKVEIVPRAIKVLEL